MDFDDINNQVDDDGGITSVQMANLRDAAGWERLTERALGNIEDHLRQRGLGVFPELSGNRYEDVRIYRLGTPLGRLVAAVLTPTLDGDELLKEIGNNRASELLTKVRDLVCER
jgi:hypothetical protein